MNEEKIFVGRDEECKLLHEVFHSNRAEFVAVYGRRRVGKTFLVKTVFSKLSDDLLFFHVTGTRDAPMSEQIHDFTRIIESVFYDSSIELKNPTDWKKTFELLTQALQRESKNRKVVLFFDELPWLASKRSRFIQALDYYWNRFWCDIPRIKLVVCGSSASWMLDNVISNKGGLHNRITRQISLDPFDLKETKQFILAHGIRYNDSQILEAFMVTGGIAYYLNFLNKRLSVAQNVDQLCFQKKGSLIEEFSRLYSSLFDHSVVYEELIRLISSKRRGIERREILKLSKYSTDGGSLNKKLDALEQSGFIISFKPYGFTKRGTFYRMIDEYSLFYLSWIEPALSSIRKLDKTKGYWLEMCQSPAWHAWAGYSFESVCYKHIAQIRKTLNIQASADVGSWQYIPKKGCTDDGAQIDLLFDRNDGVVTLCEIKYTSNPYQLTKDEANLLMRKAEVFKKRTKTEKQIQMVFITNVPIKPTMYSESIIAQNVVLSHLIEN